MSYSLYPAALVLFGIEKTDSAKATLQELDSYLGILGSERKLAHLVSRCFFSVSVLARSSGRRFPRCMDENQLFWRRTL